MVLAKWLHTGARVFILDEPTRGIDVGAKQEIYGLMNQLLADGAAIIMISSELPEVLGMADRIIVMCEGRVSGELTRKEATPDRFLELATAFSQPVAEAMTEVVPSRMKIKLSRSTSALLLLLLALVIAISIAVPAFGVATIYSTSRGRCRSTPSSPRA